MWKRQGKAGKRELRKLREQNLLSFPTPDSRTPVARAGDTLRSVATTGGDEVRDRATPATHRPPARNWLLPTPDSRFPKKIKSVFIHLALVGAIAAVCLHAGTIWALGADLPENSNFHTNISSLPNIHAAAPTDLVQQGEEFYQTEQFSKAIAVWQQATATFAERGDSLNQALVLSSLATAFEQLGQWTQANAAIEKAIALLDPQPPTANASQILAQALTIRGNLQLSQGQASQALETWQRAEATYRKVGDEIGISGSQMNQARALQAQGLARRAATLLAQVEQTLQTQPDSLLKVTGLRNLGKILRLVGNLDRSHAILQQSLTMAERMRDQKQVPLQESNASISGILLSLGNTARTQVETNSALKYYRQSTAIAPTSATKLQAQLMELSLLVEQERSVEARSLLPRIQSQLTDLPPSQVGIYARIHLAQALMKLGSRGKRAEEAYDAEGAEGAKPTSDSRLPTPRSIAQLLSTAIGQARSLSDRRAESYALGTLGSLYEQNQQWNEAQTLTGQALLLAQAIDAPDITYQWQWQLGRLLKAQSGSDRSIGAAIAAYTEAINTLQSLRSDLAAIAPEVQFSFRESVEPVYRQFAELLLQSPQGSTPSQNHLQQARQAIESLQLAELDNFFREACLEARSVQVDQINPHTAVIYPIILPNRLAVILALPKQPLSYYETPLPQAEIERIIDRMRQSLRATSFTQERLPIAQRLYDLLLRPAQAKLAASKIANLVFVLDGSLQNLPMAALYDGQHYLIENYSIALAPGLQLLPPQSLERQQLKALVGGLSQPRRGFSALPEVVSEVNKITSQVPTKILLDQTFTNTTLQHQIDSSPFSVVHLATHGQFSSKAEDTFFLTWDGQVNVKQLDRLLRAREEGDSPIELLVLSACQTATGDRRAALGMAGVALRAGARSTLASLWSVSDRSTTSLMVEFYRELGKPGVSKAEAVRRSQLSLLKQSQYQHPYYWAAFVLLGNWL
ncbi:CHAT domain-containing protein [Chroococcidiopsis sp. FACHB-1243]|uniref:CHAT domain-containing protein n=1 Tax=Chroococcidiopsis sp. [FACHB-1243] TaxID=2692781 RepID=UPI0017852484|nr:CHAT domain-containing protein [Chroococcidiopsis sp. [FACHB-1243]]MBD2308747.1 CHAT domain-containing protein [Chroococcidiopsis sp. [FACHB-1243]]